ncbi:DUF637 domain-containing protein [Pseudomonas poae]
MAWLKDAEKRGDFDWKLIKETHDSYKCSNSSLGQGAMLGDHDYRNCVDGWCRQRSAGATFAGAGTAGSGNGWHGGRQFSHGDGGYGSQDCGGGWANIAATAVITSATSGAVISTINNKGNLGAVFKDVTSSQSPEGYAVAGISGGYVPDSLGAQLAVRSALNTVANGGKFKDNVVQAALRNGSGWPERCNIQ